MMSAIGIQSSIWSNRFKTVVLVVLFPVLIFGTIFLIIYLTGAGSTPEPNNIDYPEYLHYTELKSSILKNRELIDSERNRIANGENDGSAQKNIEDAQQTIRTNENELSHYPESIIAEFKSLDEAMGRPKVLNSLDSAIGIFAILGPIILIWALISFFFHKQIIFSFTGARAISRSENPVIYNIVENLCISRGLPPPKIGILDDDSMNAFAVGWNPKRSWIVFSRGITQRLKKREIEAVAAHELTHIMNKDGLLLATTICFIGAVAAVGEIILRMGARMGSSRSSNSRGIQFQIVFTVIGAALMLLGYAILPLVQLAISRKREYLADAGSVELTHDSEALIAALRSISTDSTIESIKKDSVSALCIANPFPKTSGFAHRIHEFFSTHPSLERRIEALQSY